MGQCLCWGRWVKELLPSGGSAGGKPASINVGSGEDRLRALGWEVAGVGSVLVVVVGEGDPGTAEWCLLRKGCGSEIWSLGV